VPKNNLYKISFFTLIVKIFPH